MPWWVLIWIKRSPLVFLVLSVACFSLGLCCFTYASHQVGSMYVRFLMIVTFIHLPGICYFNLDNCANSIHVFRPCSSFCLVCLRKMGICTASRSQMAWRRARRGYRQVLSSFWNYSGAKMVENSRETVYSFSGISDAFVYRCQVELYL